MFETVAKWNGGKLPMEVVGVLLAALAAVTMVVVLVCSFDPTPTQAAPAKAVPTEYSGPAAKTPVR